MMAILFLVAAWFVLAAISVYRPVVKKSVITRPRSRFAGMSFGMSRRQRRARAHHARVEHNRRMRRQGRKACRHRAVVANRLEQLRAVALATEDEFALQLSRAKLVSRHVRRVDRRSKRRVSLPATPKTYVARVFDTTSFNLPSERPNLRVVRERKPRFRPPQFWLNRASAIRGRLIRRELEIASSPEDDSNVKPIWRIRKDETERDWVAFQPICRDAVALCQEAA